MPAGDEHGDELDPGAERRLPRDADCSVPRTTNLVLRTNRLSLGARQRVRATGAGRPWVLVLIVSGFGSKHAALAFESAWQKPHSSRHTARMWSALGLGKCSCQSSVMVRRRALALLLEHGVLGHESLSVCEL